MTSQCSGMAVYECLIFSMLTRLITPHMKKQIENIWENIFNVSTFKDVKHSIIDVEIRQVRPF